MKVAELIELLKPYEDFDLEFIINEAPKGKCFDFRNFSVELCDIGHSDKIVTLTGEEKL